jgi:uncharacterized protein YceH (UPF0502 family)
MDEPTSPPHSKPAPRWQALGPIDRRVLGVLVEKAKTTPNAYPMSLNSVCTAANQKSNRFPIMELKPEDVEESLDRLRELGAVGMIEGYGRVRKYRHYLYDWLGVDKVELAVMAELILRGAQTEGELRGRAARMEPIADLGALRPVLDSLKAKGLVIPLTPEGRGHVVSHGLYKPRELENLQAQFAAGGVAVLAPADDESEPPDRTSPPVPSTAAPASSAVAAVPAGASPAAIEPLRRQLAQLQAQVAQLRSDLDDLAAAFEKTVAEFQRLRDDLGA